MKKTLSVVLAVLMLVSLTCSVFAATGMTMNSNHGVSGTFFTYPRPTDEEEEYDIAFVQGENHQLTAKDGETVAEDGTVTVTIEAGTTIGKEAIPENVGDDAYYEIQGYYFIDEDGKEVVIDPATYEFAEDTRVYTIVVDTWIPYSDMKQDRTDWYYKYVRDLSIAGVVNGYPDGTFNPAGNVKWGEALKLIILATGFEAQAPTDEHWASGYLAFAVENGFVDGEAEYDLEAPITRNDYAHIAAAALGLEEATIETPFADTDDGHIIALFEKGIFEGSFSGEERLFKPDNYITRAEMSTVIWRINKLG